jgi:hypothetical protein
LWVSWKGIVIDRMVGIFSIDCMESNYEHLNTYCSACSMKNTKTFIVKEDTPLMSRMFVELGTLEH